MPFIDVFHSKQGDNENNEGDDCSEKVGEIISVEAADNYISIFIDLRTAAAQPLDNHGAVEIAIGDKQQGKQQDLSI